MKLLFILIIFFNFCFADSINNHVDFSVSRLGSPSLDPHSSQGDLELHLNPNIYDGLYKIDPSNGKLVPALATSYKWITPKTIEFTLRKGVTFHNGEKFDAEAVKFSFERMKNVTNGFNWIKAIVPEYKHVEIIDPYKIRIHFSKHNSIFLISSRFFIILPPKYLKENGIEHFKKHPIGTGAFVVKDIEYENDHIKQIKLKKFPNYWDKGYPKLSSVNYKFNMTQKDSLKMLLNKELNAAADLPVRSLLEVKKNQFDIQPKGQGLLVWLYFNLTNYKKDSLIYDKKFREAILYALDYEKIKKIVYRNHAEINHQWAFPGLPGYSEDIKNYSFNLDKAKELLQELNIKQKPTLHMYCDDVSLDAAKIIKSSLAQLGVDLTIDILDEASNNCILTAKNNIDSPCHDKLKYYDFMIGDFGWGLPHNYVSHLHTFSQNSFASLLSSDHPTAKRSTQMFQRAINESGDSNKAWKEITEFEFNRMGISSLFLKDVFYAKEKELIWDVYSSYEFTKAYYE